MISREDVKTYCEVVFANPAPGEFIALRGLPEAGQRGQPVLRWIDPKGHRVPTPSRVIPMMQIVVEAVQDFVERCDELGLAAYCLPGLVSRYGGASNADVCGFGTVCADFDTGNIAENILHASEVLGTPTMIVNSGGTTATGQVLPRVTGQGKRHVYWTVTGEGRTVERMVALRTAIAACFGGDMSFARPMQIIRIAGSVHRKGEPRAVSVAYINKHNTINLAQAEVRLRAIAPPPREGAAPVADNALGFARKVSLDALPMMSVGHGNADISRFEALTRMAGTYIADIYDISNAEQVEREFINYAAWCRTKIENVERDYNLRQHWYRLVSREKSKRAWRASQPRAANKYKR